MVMSRATLPISSSLDLRPDVLPDSDQPFFLVVELVKLVNDMLEHTIPDSKERAAA